MSRVVGGLYVSDPHAGSVDSEFIMYTDFEGQSSAIQEAGPSGFLEADSKRTRGIIGTVPPEYLSPSLARYG